MRRIVETVYQCGDVSRTDRTITEQVPLIWRVAIYASLVELGGGIVVMAVLLVAGVAKRHGWR